jgi:iron complex outermembrane recepter protein
MHSMRKIFFLPLFLLFAFVASAQVNSNKITGSVQDAAGKPVASATVSLLKANDSSLHKITLTGKEGLYSFDVIVDGEYLIMVTAVGLEKSYSHVFSATGNNPVVVPFLSLKAEPKNMDGVTVTAKRPFIETKIDKTVVNVDASPTSAGATAMEILEKSPGISVDNDGNISLRGKAGVVVMLDGKLSYLSAADLANMLKNMPASALDQIEIMTNPSSKYDASGNSGVINIKTKKGKNAGFNGNFMVGITSSIYKPGNTTYLIPKSQNSINFNWRKNKINFFGSYNPNFNQGRNTLTFENRFLDGDKNITGYNNTETSFKFRNNNHTLKLGLDWFANKKNSFGIVLSGFEFSGHPTPTTIGNLSDENRVLESRLVSKTKNDIKFKNGTLNLNWKHTFDSTGKELTADFDYVVYNSVSDMMLNTDYYNGQLQSVGKSSLRGHLPSAIDIYSFKTDYTHPIKGGRIEAGLKFSYVKNDNEVNYENLVNDKWETDLIRSNHFIYDENINAAYVNFSKEIKKWSFQAGLRIENTVAHGNQLGNQVVAQTKFKRDTTNLFPTAFVSYKVDDKNNFTVSYGRRINRPNYQDLNPFTYFLDSLSYRQGNIYLKPQYSHNIELSHAFKGKYITTLSYNTTDNVISQINKVDPNNPDSKIRFLTIDNVAKFRNIGLAVTTPVTINKWWSTNIFSNVFYTEYQGVFDTINIDLSFTSFMVNVTNSFNFGKGFSGEISGFYRHKGISNLSTMQPIYQVALAVQQQVMKGKGTLRLNIRDPFAWQQFEGENKYGRIDGNFLARPDIRQVTATFTYRFGKTSQQNQPPRRRNSASQDEQNRVGQGGQ